MTENKFEKYGQSSKGNYKVIDTIGVPHPYCITPRHVAYVADHFNGMLGAEAIRQSEKYGKAVCDICKKAKQVLSYDDHEQALLVDCKVDFNIEKNKKELHKYLLKIKALAESEKFAGFAFKKSF